VTAKLPSGSLPKLSNILIKDNIGKERNGNTVGTLLKLRTVGQDEWWAHFSKGSQKETCIRNPKRDGKRRVFLR
jgi:hypothetical protein